MGKFKQKLMNLAIRLYINTVGSSLRQGENIAPAGGRQPAPEMPSLLRRAAAEGAVLLKNDGTLPLTEKIALFGRVQTDTFYTGYGSGGNVLKPYRVSILDGIEQSRIELDDEVVDFYKDYARENPVNHGYWGNWPRAFPEAPLDEAFIRASAERVSTAVVVIGRAAGEDRENELNQGSFYLTDEENRLLDLVTQSFSKTVVLLNLGNIIDLSFLENKRINAALLLWQGGMETGNAAAQLLSGDVNPCGKLSSAVARKYTDYPSADSFGGATYNEYREDIYVGYRYFETFARDAVLFPFGFGLSYTKFELSAEYDGLRVTYNIRNIGKYAGKEVIQVYVKKPGDSLGNPARELAAFRKTRSLAPDEVETGELVLSERSFSSYDETRSAYVMLAGEYEIYIGTDVRSARKIGSFRLSETKLIEQLSEQCAPNSSFAILSDGGVTKFSRLRKKDLKKEILSSLPTAYEKCNRKIKLKDVKAGKESLKDFVAQLSPEELEAVSRGDFVMDSPLGAKGNAGVFGGVTASLRDKGIPPVTATDGPSGIRLQASCSLLPIGTQLACTFDEELVENIYATVGREMKERDSDVLLAPAMNIHRNPLCGRNFEYFSEDPFLTGKIAAAVVRGVQSEGVSACPKHFACNNQEFNRSHNDSRLSERALREIYLKGFEICVKEAKPDLIMTSYNKVNGVWAHYHYELVRGILRGEWNFDGCVITDWWMRSGKSPEFPKLRNNAYRVRAGVNILMPGSGKLGLRKSDGTLLKTLGTEGGITLGELQRNAEEVLRFVLRSSALARFEKEKLENLHR